MKKIFRKNQIVITALAVMLAVAGYLNYAGKEDLTKTDAVAKEVENSGISEEDILAENGILSKVPEEGESVSMDIGSLDLDLTENVGSSDTSGNGEAVTPGEAVLTNGQSVAEYIADVQLSREQVRAKNQATLLEIINNENIAEEQKQDAINRMVALTANAEKENAAETLLKAKGFVNPVVSVMDNQVEVVINASSLTDAERAQIEDIVKRKTEMSADNIVISLLNLTE